MKWWIVAVASVGTIATGGIGWGIYRNRNKDETDEPNDPIVDDQTKIDDNTDSFLKDDDTTEQPADSEVVDPVIDEPE